VETSGRIFQLNVSAGGVPKHRIAEAEVTHRGLVGDSQRDQRAHGSPDQALCIFAIEQIALMRIEGHRLGAGATGENVTTEGIDWNEVTPGCRLRLGDEVLVEVTGYATPCWKNAQWFVDGNIHRMDQATHPGSSRVYARVLRTGHVREGDPIQLLNGDAIDRVVRRQVPAFRWPRDFVR
jgi:MOSC domain-containing protein YiiM